MVTGGSKREQWKTGVGVCEKKKTMVFSKCYVFVLCVLIMWYVFVVWGRGEGFYN